MIDQAEQELVRDALEFIEEEHRIMVSSYTVRALGDRDYGKVIDKAAKREIAAMAAWIRRAREFLK